MATEHSERQPGFQSFPSISSLWNTANALTSPNFVFMPLKGPSLLAKILLQPNRMNSKEVAFNAQFYHSLSLPSSKLVDRLKYVLNKRSIIYSSSFQLCGFLIVISMLHYSFIVFIIFLGLNF